MSIAVTSSLAPTTADTPLDARTVVATLNDIAYIQMPYIGMLFYCKATSKHYTVTALASRTIGAFTVPNAAVGSYAEFPAAAQVGDMDPEDYYTSAQVDALLGGKMNAPSSSGTVGQVLTRNANGYGWETPQGGGGGGGADANAAMEMALIYG